MKEIINQIESVLKEEWKNEPTGHDWEHIRRVRDMSMHIQSLEGGDRDVIELGALLHDISDHKFNGGKLNAGGQKAKEWLIELGANMSIANEVASLVDKISFKGAKVDAGVLSLETKIVQDADRLDAIGAIGIARAFAFGGNRNQIIYAENTEPVLHESFESYVNAKTTTINHFYEKLLLLKNKMNTTIGIQLAEERHQFMKDFLTQFYSEWKLNR
ncbi:HD domain-containing protein [Crocinitomicaceae bacterium]|jgi:uncharacterized protein|nr:HD domain-containing protein [Crocinitomicaceae bacterium]MDG1346669.1 HD domain-containing protein [Crocinitomicaceae bacterium]MDG2464486.1 HD domain-containing protein [Crocinitomicaceae bacterium]